MKDTVLHTFQNGYTHLPEGERKNMNQYCDGYKSFLDAGKTERECVTEGISLAEKNGFIPFVRGMKLHSGCKIYKNVRGKMLLLAVIGTEPMACGCRIAAAHIDCPRLDLKPSPLYEDDEIAYLKTHYYGAIHKYQWVAMPMEIRGVVALKNGDIVTVNIGVKDGPKVIISDLLPHLAGEQNKKSMTDRISGEQLNLIIGSEPAEGEGTERVKYRVMKELCKKYGFTEADFLSAELEAVPAVNAMDIGFDCSMIGAYGQDDRVCSYAALKALLDLKAIPVKTAICVLADKEEIGSIGVSSMQSIAFDTFVKNICESQKENLGACFENSICLSADVAAAFDPAFPDVYEKRNTARLNYGVSISKYTGAHGKSGASDASAELLAYIRRIFDEYGIVWQISELGKVDAGGGSTIAAFMSNRNIDTIDVGVPVLSMHAPVEIVAKLDSYMTYKAINTFYLDSSTI